MKHIFQIMKNRLIFKMLIRMNTHHVNCMRKLTKKKSGFFVNHLIFFKAFD